jgi:hypothetical protein
MRASHDLTTLGPEQYLPIQQLHQHSLRAQFRIPADHSPFCFFESEFPFSI